MSKSKSLTIEGMTCGHCAMSVTKELSKLPGAENVAVDVAAKSASLTVNDEVTDEALREAVEEAGYQLTAVA